MENVRRSVYGFLTILGGRFLWGVSMRKVLLGGTSAIALAIAMAGLASAADIATMDPVIEAPIIEEEAFSWTGLYIGGHGGYGFANFEGIVDGTDSSAATADGLDLSGIAAGGHIGFNYQIRNVVVGIEADATWTDWSDTQPAAGSSSSGIDGSVDLLASVRGRLGLAMDNGLVYVTGGAAWAPEAEAENFHSDSTTETVDFDDIGAVFGAGAEWALTDWFILRGEGLYYMFNDKSTEPEDHESGDTGDFLAFEDAFVARAGASILFNGF